MIIVVGSPLFSTHGAHGAQKHIEILHYYTWLECSRYAVTNGYDIIGISNVETEGSSAIERSSLSGRIIFAVGTKEGLSPELLDICSRTVHVSVPVKRLEEKLPYENKVGICLQLVSSKYPGRSETSVCAEKFSVDESSVFKSFKLNFKKHSSSVTEQELFDDDVLSEEELHLGNLFE